MDLLVSVDGLLAGITAVFTTSGLSMLLIGVCIGIAIGAIPGMSPSMGVALMVPFTYGMEPAAAFILFVAAYQAANYGGSITAIAVNAPGTASAVVTAIDGFKMTSKGEPGKALGTALFSSTLGGLIGTVALIVCAVPIASLALKFGPPDYFSLAIFGLTTVVAFGRGSWLKGLAAVLLGLFLATVGMDPFTGEERFTFGIPELSDGLPFIPVMIGLFAMAEVLAQIHAGLLGKTEIENFVGKIPPIRAIKKLSKTILRSSAIGTAIGVIPGAGATIASFISYGQAKRWSKEPEEFGEGSAEGIAASEAANSSSVGGALIPLLSLGVPGSATDAVLLGALTLHGLVAGPELFQGSPDVVYGIFVTLLLANILILAFGLLGNTLWLQVMRAPKSLLYVLITAMCVLGSFTTRNLLFDCWICIGFGALGWLFKRVGMMPAAVILGLVLGDMVELNFRRATLAGGYSTFFTSPLSCMLLILSFLSLIKPLIPTKNREDRDR